jgi:branched-chain amino acid transport system substrate-binding protein
MESPDYAPYMAQIDAENTDFIWSFHLGGDAIRFVQALDEYGIKDEVPVLCSPATVSEGWLAPMGDAALGIESTTNYSPVLDTPENAEFAQALWDKDQLRPTIPIEHGYVAARMAILALEEMDGDVDDLDSLIEALENLEFEAPRGPVKFEQHTPVQNLYHRVVERVDGELQNTVVGTYPDIGPVWVPAGLE